MLVACLTSDVIKVMQILQFNNTLAMGSNMQILEMTILFEYLILGADADGTY